MAPPLVDLVILIDTSPGMKADACAISAAAAEALNLAQQQLPRDIRMVWLGIEGCWPHTAFQETLRTYLTQVCKVSVPTLRSRQREELLGAGAQEDAARAIEDVTSYFDWRPQAKRHLLYLGNESLDAGGDKPDAASEIAVKLAIQAAQATGVQVHTHLGLSKSRYRDLLALAYAQLASATGGLGFVASEDTPTNFVTVLMSIFGHGQTSVHPTFDTTKETNMSAKKNVPNSSSSESEASQTASIPVTDQSMTYVPTTQTGLQDYAYWWDYARKHAKKGKGTKDFRRGRIWT